MRKINILCYHSFDTSDNDYFSISTINLETQVRYLKSLVEFVDLDTIVAIWRKQISKSKMCVAVTIDDGYEDIIRALPVFNKYKIPLTLFILAEPEKANRKELSNHKKLLTDNQIKTLIKEGVQIGSHTCTHPNLSLIDNKQCQREISRSKKILENKYGVEVKYFAYPKGIYSKQIEEYAKSAGYEAAFTIFEPLIGTQASQFTIPRIILDSKNINRPLNLILHPIYQKVRSLYNVFISVKNYKLTA